MTALLIYVPGNGDTVVPDACKRIVPVFDGRTRRNLKLAFKRFGTGKNQPRISWPSRHLRGALFAGGGLRPEAVSHRPPSGMWKYVGTI